MKSCYLAVRIPIELREKLKECAQRKGITTSDLVRDMFLSSTHLPSEYQDVPKCDHCGVAGDILREFMDENGKRILLCYDCCNGHVYYDWQISSKGEPDVA